MLFPPEPDIQREALTIRHEGVLTPLTDNPP